MIAKNQGGSTTSEIASHSRMGIPSSEANADTPNISNLITFNSSNLNNTYQSTYNSKYNPFDGFFYPGNLSSSLTNYITPTLPTDNNSTKYLMINCVTTSPLKIFTLRLGASSQNITNVYVLWKGPTVTTSWYDASVLYNSAGGCKRGDSGENYTWQIQINSSADSSYVGDIGGGNIYINIKFTGKIKMNQIVVTT